MSSVLTLLLSTGCGADPTAAEAQTEPPETDAVVDFAAAHQRIAGFGASSAWTATELPDWLADAFFSAKNGIGLSLLRVRIDPRGFTQERATAVQAVARGASVWASPWSPPGDWKDNGSATNGGSLLPQHRRVWAERLAAFAKGMSDDGLPLAVISAQNEPNWTAEWETCRWTEEELADFIGKELGPALERAGVSTPILAPETINWNSIGRYADRLLSDPAIRSTLGALATHSYGGSPFAVSPPARGGLPLWQTEVSDSEEDAPDPGMDSALRVARMIHDHLTLGQVSAWHYWWLLPRGDRPTNNGSLMGGDTLARRAHVLGNWSKFVRPGFWRVPATENPRSGVRLTAFRDSRSARFAIVAVNETSSTVTQRWLTNGSEAVWVQKWVTSEEHPLAQLGTLEIRPDGFSHTLSPRSVTTFSGMLDGSAPDPYGEKASGEASSPIWEPMPTADGVEEPEPVKPAQRGGGTACVCGVAGADSVGWRAWLGGLAFVGFVARRRARRVGGRLDG